MPAFFLPGFYHQDGSVFNGPHQFYADISHDKFLGFGHLFSADDDYVVMAFFLLVDNAVGHCGIGLGSQQSFNFVRVKAVFFQTFFGLYKDGFSPFCLFFREFFPHQFRTCGGLSENVKEGYFNVLVMKEYGLYTFQHSAGTYRIAYCDQYGFVQGNPP